MRKAAPSVCPRCRRTFISWSGWFDDIQKHGCYEKRSFNSLNFTQLKKPINSSQCIKK